MAKAFTPLDKKKSGGRSGGGSPELQPRTGATNKTPAPTHDAPDLISSVRNPHGGNGYGQNSPQPSRIEPGEIMQSPLAENIEASSHRGADVTLADIRGSGTGKANNTPDNWQTRAVSPDQKVPTTFGHYPRNASAVKVPPDTKPSSFNPLDVRKPGA